MVDKLSQGESLEQESNLGSIQKQTQEVICRIFFVRHGQSKEEYRNLWLPQDPTAELSKLWEDQIHKVWQKFEELWIDDTNAVIVYAWWTTRIIQSKKKLEKYNIGVTKWNSLENPLLETTRKKYNPETKAMESEKSHMQGVAEQLKNMVDLVHWEILESFKQSDGIYSDKKNIILLGHKSSEGFPELANESKEDTILHSLRIKPGEMFELDIGAANKLINYEKNKDVLHLTGDNYVDILKILWQEEEIRKEIKRFNDKEIQLYELQNLINRHFKGHPELYEKHLSSDNEDLRVFCLVNMFELCEAWFDKSERLARKEKTYNLEIPYKERERVKLSAKYEKVLENIKEIYLKSDKLLSLSEKKIFLSSMKNSGRKIRNLAEEVIIQNFLTNEKWWEEDAWALFKMFKLDNFYKLLKDKKEFYKNIVNFQKRSLDKKIQQQQKWWIIERDVFEIKKEKNKESEWEQRRDEYSKKKIEIWKEITGHYILPAHVGNGKSIWLSELAKKLVMDKDSVVKFFEGSYFDSEEKINDIDMPILIEWNIHRYESAWNTWYISYNGTRIAFRWREGFEKEFPIGTPVEVIIKKKIRRTQDRFDIDEFREIEDIQRYDYFDPHGRPASPPLSLSCDYPELNLDKKNFLLIDGIDEIKDSKIKQILIDELENSPYTVIATSRLSEYFNDKENDWFNTLYMDPINKNEFIDSRIQDPKKRDIVKKKIEQLRLAWEIEGNPLLLNFICILANEEWKYSNIWVKDLNTINNKADLYENVTKLIIYQHPLAKSQSTVYDGLDEKQKIKSLKSTLDILGEFAYMISKNIDVTDFYIDRHLNKVDILFKKIGNDKNGKDIYWFIHKSFEEFLLARYLANQGDGDGEIYKVRDEVAWEDNRNERKSFRPVVDFYAETLINSDKINKLKNFLWKDGLLKNDDATGYSLYIWLDILNWLEENEETAPIFAIYERILQEMNKKVPNNKYLFFSHFIKKETTNTRIKRHIDKNMLYSIMRSNIQDVLKTIDYKKIWENFRKLIRMGESEWNNLLYEYIVNSPIMVSRPNIYTEIIEEKNEDTLNVIHEWIDALCDSHEYKRALYMCWELIKTDNKRSIEQKYICIEGLFKEKEYHNLIWHLESRAKTWDKRAIRQIYKYIKTTKEIEGDEKDYYSIIAGYKTLLEIGEDNIEAKIIEYMKNFFEEKKYYEIMELCEMLAESKFKEIERLVYEYANKLFDIWKYSKAGNIYKAMVENGNKDVVSLACICANKSYVYGERGLWGHKIYCTLVKTGDQEILEVVHTHIKELFEEEYHELIGNVFQQITKKLNIKDILWIDEYVNNIFFIWEGDFVSGLEYIEDRDERIMKFLDKKAKELSNIWDYDAAGHLYKEMIKKWNTQVIEQVYAYIGTLFDQWDYTSAATYLRELIYIWDKRITMLSFACADKVFSMGEYYIAWITYEELFKIWEKWSQKLLLKCIEKLFNTWCQDHVVVGLLDRLIESWDKEVQKLSYEYAKKMFKKEKYIDAYNIYRELAKGWDKKAIEFKYNCLQKIDPLTFLIFTNKE